TIAVQLIVSLFIVEAGQYRYPLKPSDPQPLLLPKPAPLVLPRARLYRSMDSVVAKIGQEELNANLVVHASIAMIGILSVCKRRLLSPAAASLVD
ncbi:hypothetical protein FRC17_004957, partial [Serendipita sp. 399]